MTEQAESRDPAFILAIDFGGTKTAVATATPEGQLLCSERFSTEACGSAEGVLQQALATCGKLTYQVQNTAPDTKLAAVGISTMGITLPDRVVMAPNVCGWENLKIECTMRRYYPGIPIRIINDVKSATLAELRCGQLHGTKSGMYLNLGTGIAIGLTLGTEVVNGSNGSAGEVAYCLVDREEEAGYLDGRTPLESIVGGVGIGRHATQRFGRPMAARDVFDAARHDADVSKYLDDVLAVLAWQVTNMAILWDPEKVVVGGGMVAAKDIIIPALSEYFKRFVPFPPQLCTSHFSSNASLRGAIEVALDVVKCNN